MTKSDLQLDETATLIGRVERKSIGPSIVTVRDGVILDISKKSAPTVRDVLELDDPVTYVRSVKGEPLGQPAEIAEASLNENSSNYFLAPCDLQVVKASGVTFAQSMVERVIEEKAIGDPSKAEAIRARVSSAIGDRLSNIVPGSENARKVKEALIVEGIWSQYLEVGIGPDAEVFTKAPVLSSIGWGAKIGLHPDSRWNNPEPEIVLAVNSQGSIKGATLGNDVNLRDIEGRSALLLSKAKDNNASCALGPFIRLFDEAYSLDDVREAKLTLRVEGRDGYLLEGYSSMKEISRDPDDIVAQTIGRHHQYPDGLMLFLGTLFSPTQDRGVPGEGFTHKLGDLVEISSERLGRLCNTVQLSTECPEWTFGISALMQNLRRRDLI